MLAACYRLFPRKPKIENAGDKCLCGLYPGVPREHIKYVDQMERVGLIGLNTVDSRNKIHTKKMPITTWLFDEKEAAGIFNRAADERLFTVFRTKLEGDSLGMADFSTF